MLTTDRQAIVELLHHGHTISARMFPGTMLESTRAPSEGQIRPRRLAGAARRPQAYPRRVPIRDAQPDDAAACAAIYAPYVRDTAITFELDAPDAEAMATRIAAAQRGHAWLVAVEGDQLLGYAYGGEFKSRAAYRFTCEVSVYLRRGLAGRGLGRALYDVLLPRLAGRGYRSAVAGMTLPNPASEGLHRAMGFEPVGTFRGVGWKLGRWHDVLFAQRPLLIAPDPPAEPS